MYKNILIPVAPDHGSSYQQCFKAARRLLAEGGRITILAVIESAPSYVAEYVTVVPEAKIQEAVSDRIREIADGQADVDIAVTSGVPGIVIPEFAAEQGNDLIIVQSHRPDFQDYLLGSTAARVVRRARCPVFVLRD
jgi:nucleotide-binding universal stress UspA family protein